MSTTTPPGRAELRAGKNGTGRTDAERFRWWVMLVGVALIVLNCFWIARAEGIENSGCPTCLSLFYNAVFTLLALLVVNVAIRRIRPGGEFGRGELLVIYAMVVSASALIGIDYMLTLVATIAHPAAFATPENSWASTFFPHLPGWLTFTAPSESIIKYEYGHSRLTWEYFRPWLTPIAAWSVFLMALCACWLSINVILRKHWVEHERLSYPIIQIPLLMTENGGDNALFRNRVFWLGFGLVAALDILNGLHQFYPALPSVNVKLNNITPLYAEMPPWNAMGVTFTSFFPFVIGLSFLMPTNMAFSCVFFFILRKLELVGSAALGHQPAGQGAFPYLQEQTYGAWIALFVATLWFGRGYLKQVWGAAFSEARRKEGDGRTYRWAFGILGAALFVTLGFLVLAGLSPYIALLYVTLYLLFCCSITRVRAELGPPTHEMAGVSTTGMMALGMGTQALGPQNLTVLSLLLFQNVLYRSLLMPQQAECLKAASESRLPIRTMVIALAIAAVIGIYAGFYVHLSASYARTTQLAFNPGAPGSWWANAGFRQLSAAISHPSPPNLGSVAGIGAGALITLMLARLSVAFYGFPFHPAGFALGMAFGLDYIWLPVLIAWVLKVAILRYSGLGGYRRAMPFFVGLVLGEFAVGGLWSFARGVLGVPTYSFFGH